MICNLGDPMSNRHAVLSHAMTPSHMRHQDDALLRVVNPLSIIDRLY